MIHRARAKAQDLAAARGQVCVEAGMGRERRGGIPTGREGREGKGSAGERESVRKVAGGKEGETESMPERQRQRVY